MNKENFIDEMYNVSIIGRSAYSILCLENYIKSKYPYKDWNLLLSRLWEITSVDSIDKDWWYPVQEIIPEYLFEFDNYEDSDFEYLSKSEYNKFIELYKDVKNDSNLCMIIKTIWDSIGNVLYGLLIDNGKIMSEQIYSNIVTILERNHISLPSIDIVKFSSFSEYNGWGNSFDGTKLSQFQIK